MADYLFLCDINLNGNALKNAVVEVLSTAPESPVKGQIYFNDTNKKFEYYNGTEWIAGAQFDVASLGTDEAGVQYSIFDSREGDTFKFRVIKSADSRFKMNMSNGVIEFSLDMKFQSAMPDDLTVPTAIGAIAKGTTAADLKAKTVDQILDDMLFPELNPKVTAPSASIKFANGFTANGCYEVGAAAPTASNFTPSFSKGSSVVAGQATLARSGDQVMESSYIWYGSNSVQQLPTTIAAGTMSYGYHAAYAEGPVLVTSKGNKATKNDSGSTITNPLAAGAVDSGKLTIYGTYPFFSNGVTCSATDKDVNFPSEFAESKCTLQRWDATTYACKFTSEATLSTRLWFEFPATKKVTKVEFMNTVSGQWESYSGWSTAASEARMVQGTSVNYNRLTTTGEFGGAIQLRFTIANA